MATPDRVLDPDPTPEKKKKQGQPVLKTAQMYRKTDRRDSNKRKDIKDTLNMYTKISDFQRFSLQICILEAKKAYCDGRNAHYCVSKK